MCPCRCRAAAPRAHCQVGHTADLLKEMMIDSQVSVSTQTEMHGDDAERALGLLLRQQNTASVVCQTDFQHEHALLAKVAEHEELQNTLQLEVHKLEVEVEQLLLRAETAERQAPALHKLVTEQRQEGEALRERLDECEQRLAEQTALAESRCTELARLAAEAAARTKTRVLAPRRPAAKKADDGAVDAPTREDGLAGVEVCDMGVQVNMDGASTLAKAKRGEESKGKMARATAMVMNKMRKPAEPQFSIGWVLRNIALVLRARISAARDDEAVLKRPLAKFMHSLYVSAYGLPAIAKKQVEALVTCARLHVSQQHRRRSVCISGRALAWVAVGSSGAADAELGDSEQAEAVAGDAMCVPVDAAEAPAGNPDLFELMIFLRFFAAGASAAQAALAGATTPGTGYRTLRGSDTAELNFAVRVMEQAQHLGKRWGAKGVRDSTARHVVFPSVEGAAVEGDASADFGSAAAAASIGGRVAMTQRPLSWVAVHWALQTLRDVFPRLGWRATAALRAQLESVQQSGEDDAWAQSSVISKGIDKLLSATPRVTAPVVLTLALRTRDSSRRRERALLRGAFERAAVRFEAVAPNQRSRPASLKEDGIDGAVVPAAAAAAADASAVAADSKVPVLYTISDSLFAALLDDINPGMEPGAVVALHAACAKLTLDRERKRRVAARKQRHAARRSAAREEEEAAAGGRGGARPEEEAALPAGLSDYESDSEAEYDAAELQAMAGAGGGSGAVTSMDFAVVAQAAGLGNVLCSDHEGTLVTARTVFVRYAEGGWLARPQFETLCDAHGLDSAGTTSAFAELVGTSGSKASLDTFVPWWVSNGGARLRYCDAQRAIDEECTGESGSAAAGAEIDFV